MKILVNKAGWTRDQKLVTVSAFLIVVIGVSAFFVPEVRRSLHLENPPETTHAIQSTTTGNGNVVVTGNGNVVLSGNTTAPPNTSSSELKSPQAVNNAPVKPDIKRKRKIEGVATEQRTTSSQTASKAQQPNGPNCDFTSVISNSVYRYGAQMPVMAADKTLVGNNLVQGAKSESTGKIIIEGKDSRATHNTIEGMTDAEIHGTGEHELVDNNLIRRNTNENLTQDAAGNGADMEKILKAQTGNVYVPPCPNMGHFFPDTIEQPKK
jgi:hypothetical protein